MNEDYQIIFNPVISFQIPELLEFAKQHGEECHYKSNTVVVRFNDPATHFYYIQSGRIRYLVSQPDGNERILSILEQHSFFGVCPLVFNSVICGADIITESDSILYKISKQKFYELHDSSIKFNNLLVRGLCEHLVAQMDVVENFLFASTKQRLYHMFASARDRESVDGCWHNLKYKYSQNDMANIIGCSRMTISRLITELCDDGVLRIVNRNYQVKYDRVYGDSNCYSNHK